VSEEITTRYKQQAAEQAVTLVRAGMMIGLGTGSTAIFVTRRIAALHREGALADIRGFATSRVVNAEAVRLGIPMLPEDMPHELDITIDGADEIDPQLNLIKGGGGALLREKIAAQASRRLVIVADDSKLSSRLGTLHAVPVEVLPFGWQSQARFITSLGAEVAVRQHAGGSAFRTDQDNMVLDCQFGAIADPLALASRLSGRAGIVAHGLFLGLAHEAIVAGPNGIQTLKLGAAGSG
jgi:ribose 5-phosphate isomerase A